VILVAGDKTRAWTERLVDVLAARVGLPTELLRIPGLRSRDGVPSEGLERRVFPSARRGHSSWRDASQVASSETVTDWRRRLVVNATGFVLEALPPQIGEATVISPTFQGQHGLAAVALPLAKGEPAHLGVNVTRGASSRVLYGAWLAASERPFLHKGLDRVLARAITMMAGAADHLTKGGVLPEPAPAPTPHQAPTALRVLTQRATTTELARVGRQLRKPFVLDGWRIGLRSQSADTPPAELDLSPGSFGLIRNPPGRFYADPFLLTHEGKTALFFEDYDYALRRARISSMLIDELGRPGRAHQALSRPYHLSYPFVFVHDGAALMAPETSGNRTIELYEAVSFPGEWRRRAVLVEDIDANDTTLHFDEATGLWWMFTAISEFGGSSHDTLSLFFSERLEGPWRAHPGNPVKLDPASSRPAGPLLRWNGLLYRAAQDCTRTYGGGVVWCVIRQLDPYAFREEVVATTRFRPRSQPPHTYARYAGLEVADFKTSRWRGLS
jgi:hypothetical protein